MQVNIYLNHEAAPSVIETSPFGLRYWEQRREHHESMRRSNHPIRSTHGWIYVHIRIEVTH